jgi:hypothetical protein
VPFDLQTDYPQLSMLIFVVSLSGGLMFKFRILKMFEVGGRIDIYCFFDLCGWW